jgi:hypothetical protein
MTKRLSLIDMKEFTETSTVNMTMENSTINTKIYIEKGT